MSALYDHPPPDFAEIHRQTMIRHHAQMVSTIMGRRVVDYHGFSLFVRCQACGRETTTKTNDLAARLQPALWKEVVPRLRCGACGTAPTEVRLQHAVADWWLVGDKPGLTDSRIGIRSPTA